MLLGMQLFSVRKYGDYAQSIRELGQMGYESVEGFGAQFEDIKNTRAAMDEAGIVMPTIHMGFDMLDADFDKGLQICREYGVDTIYIPGAHELGSLNDVAGVTAFAKRLGDLGKRVQDAGFGYGWHNHHDEMRKLEDGRRIIEVLLDEAPHIEWQSDITWVDKGGADPLELTGKYVKRVTALHFREFTVRSEQPGPLGRMLDFSAYTAPARGSQLKHLIVEHEAQPDRESFNRFAQEIADTYKTIKK